MIEGRWAPSIRRMTGFAIRSQYTFVGIVFGMAGNTILGSGLQVRDRTGAGMAIPAGRLDMFSGQCENHKAMVEGLPVSVDAVMASQAIIPKILSMRFGKISLVLLVTGETDHLIKIGETVSMAIHTRKCFPVRARLMGLQGIPKNFVGDIYQAQVCQGCVGAPVIRMAIAAGHVRVIQAQIPV